MPASVSRMPSTRPGKKPATTAAAGNFLQCEDTVDSQVEFEDEATFVAVEVGLEKLELVDEAVDEAAAGDDDELGWITVHPPLEQEYPCGQQALPHCTNGTLSFVVKRAPFGWDVTFCC
jgi:hypothetical protein